MISRLLVRAEKPQERERKRRRRKRRNMRLLPNVPTDSLSATETTWMNGETESGRHLSANRNPNGSQNISRY